MVRTQDTMSSTARTAAGIASRTAADIGAPISKPPASTPTTSGAGRQHAHAAGQLDRPGQSELVRAGHVTEMRQHLLGDVVHDDLPGRDAGAHRVDDDQPGLVAVVLVGLGEQVDQVQRHREDNHVDLAVADPLHLAGDRGADSVVLTVLVAHADDAPHNSVHRRPPAPS